MRSTRSLLAMLLMGTVGLFSSPFVFAQDSFSDNFITRDTVTSDFGGTSTSTSFSAVESGGEISDGEASSTSFMLNAGPLFFNAQAPKSQNWRWYDDEENETPTTALADENVAPANIENGNIVKLRTTVAETAGVGAENVKLRIQFSTSSDFSDDEHFVVEQNECTGNSGWCYSDGVDDDGDIISTALLSDADACSGGIGAGCGTHNESGTSTSAFMHEASAIVEYEFTVEQSGALANTVYFFRVFDVAASSSIPLNTGETYPSLSTGGATLTFSIDGISASTATEGVTTDISTTPVSVPFGTLASNVAIEGAHRLTVSTSANQGYKIFAFQRQGLLGASAEINPVSGTNATPSGWSTGCDESAPGCYGYHSGEDVLEGGSTRFSANDTYAQFSATPHEVAFNGAPTVSKTTDIIYKVEARELQASDAYSSTLVYIVTPVF